MCVEIKDFIFLVLGIILGLVVGIGVYWWPLKQFCNEWKALWNLCYKRYERGTRLKIKTGTELKPISNNPPKSLKDQEYIVWNDEGVGWHFSNGWIRARILHISDPTDPPETSHLYKICHLDILKSWPNKSSP